MRPESNHIKHWHHYQPKTLRRQIYEPLSLYGTQLSHFYLMWDLDLHLDFPTNYFFFVDIIKGKEKVS